MSDLTIESRRCRAEAEVYRIGRAVVEFRQCRRMTKHPSGFCHSHRSDDGDGQR